MKSIEFCLGKYIGAIVGAILEPHCHLVCYIGTILGAIMEPSRLLFSSLKSAGIIFRCVFVHSRNSSLEPSWGRLECHLGVILDHLGS